MKVYNSNELQAGNTYYPGKILTPSGVNYAITSVDFRKYTSSGDALTVQGYKDGVLVGTYLSDYTSTTATTINFNNAVLDEIRVVQGAPINGWNYASFDNLVYTDTAPPTVSTVSVPADKTYKLGDTLSFTVNTTEYVYVTGTPRIALNIGGATKYASYVSGSGSSALVFSYTVEGDLIDSDGIVVGALGLNGGTLKDFAANDMALTLNGLASTAGVLVESVAPTVTSVGVPSNATYKLGQSLDFTVNFSENVTVNTGGGSPSIPITLDTGGAVQAAYASGSGTSALVFSYSVLSGNLDSTGVAVGAAVSANGGTLRDAAGNDAILTLSSVASTTGVLVDGVVPTISSITLVGTPAANSASIQYTATFSESVTGVDTTDFTLTKTDTANGTIASVSGSGSVYTVTVNSITGAGTLRLDLNASGTGIADIATNAIAAGFTGGTEFAVDTVPPAAPSVPDMTAATDTGSSNTDNETGVATPVFTGTAEAGATVTLVSSVAGTIGSGIATGGNWSITSSTLAIGAHNITANATDAAGNVGTASSALAIVILSDLDGDGDPDVTDPDIDGDGMLNSYEDANGLDKWNAADRDTDLDGDGVSNYDESVAIPPTAANADDYPPVVTPPGDVYVNAVGLFTAVDLGVATANDALDGTVTAVSDAPTHFAPGTTTVTWSATDAAGNTGTATQLVNVNPQASFSKNQVTAEGSTVTFSVILNGNAVSYPVDVPYTVSGTAATDGSDHTLTDGVATIDSGTEMVVSFDTFNDGIVEGTETIVITIGTPTNAVAGPSRTHSIDIVEGNVAPTVSLAADQGGGTTLVPMNDGDVRVISTVLDPNGGSHTYDWSATDNALVDTDSADDTFTFDPSALTPGLYTVRLSVSDGLASDTTELSLNVVAAAPVLTTANSDGVGANDITEGYGDSDNDGVADYLDASAVSNVQPIEAGVFDRNLMETEPGLRLTLGAIALQEGRGQVGVTAAVVAADTGVTQDRNSNVGGLVDFEVHGLPVAGQTISVVIPQQAVIPSNAVYRKLVGSSWQSFVEDANNGVASAPGAAGYCPPPGDVAWQPGLTAGDWCVQLSIEDGGQNDTDGVADRRIKDPGGVALGSLSVHAGGGAMGPLWLLLMGIVGLLQLTRRERETLK